MKKVQIVGRKTIRYDFGGEMPRTVRWWETLFIRSLEHYQEPDGEIVFYRWSCPFTPWRLFAAYHVKSSKWYKNRISP